VDCKLLLGVVDGNEKNDSFKPILALIDVVEGRFDVVDGFVKYDFGVVVGNEKYDLVVSGGEK